MSLERQLSILGIPDLDERAFAPVGGRMRLPCQRTGEHR